MIKAIKSENIIVIPGMDNVQSIKYSDDNWYINNWGSPYSNTMYIDRGYLSIYPMYYLEAFPYGKITFYDGTYTYMKPSYKSKNGNMYYNQNDVQGYLLWKGGENSWIIARDLYYSEDNEGLFIYPQEAWVWYNILDKSLGGIYNGNTYWEYTGSFPPDLTSSSYVFKPRGANRGAVYQDYDSTKEITLTFDINYAKLNNYIWKNEDYTPQDSIAGRYTPWGDLSSKTYIVGVPYYTGVFNGNTIKWYRSFEKTSIDHYSYSLKSEDTFAFSYGSQIIYNNEASKWIIGTYNSSSWFESPSEPNINSPVTFTQKYLEENESNVERTLMLTFSEYGLGETYDELIYMGEAALCL